MRRRLIVSGVFFLLVGIALTVGSFVSQVPSRDAMPVVTGTIARVWTVTRRNLTETRLDLRTDAGGAQEVWIPEWLLPPRDVAAHAGRKAVIGHGRNGFVLDMVVEGHRVLDYQTVARHRDSVLPTVRWIGFGVTLGGMALILTALVIL